MWYEQFTNSCCECCLQRKSFSQDILGTCAIISSAIFYGVLPLLIQNENGFLQLNYTHVTALTWQIFEVGPHECHLGSVVMHMKERNLPLLFSEYKEYLQHSRQSVSTRGYWYFLSPIYFPDVVRRNRRCRWKEGSVRVPNCKSFIVIEAERKHVRRRARFQQHRDASCHQVFFPARQGTEGNSSHSDRNIRGICAIVCDRQKLDGLI